MYRCTASLNYCQGEILVFHWGRFQKRQLHNRHQPEHKPHLCHSPAPATSAGHGSAFPAQDEARKIPQTSFGIKVGARSAQNKKVQSESGSAFKEQQKRPR